METPDFDQLARATIDKPEWGEEYDREPMVRRVAEQLRQAWNARGAADADLLRRALACVEAHGEEYPDARPLADEIRRAVDQ